MKKLLVFLSLIIIVTFGLSPGANAETCPYFCIFICVEPGNCATLNDFLFADVQTKAILADAGWSDDVLMKSWDLSSPGIPGCPNPNHWKLEHITKVPLVYDNGALFCRDPAWANRYMAMTDNCDLSHFKPEDILIKPLPSGRIQRYLRIGAAGFVSRGFVYSLYILDPDKNPDNGFMMLNCGNFSPPPECGPGFISGYKWKDLNVDGLWDKPAEPSIAGWKMTLFDSSGLKVAETLTNASGYYLFDNLEPGCYSVHEENRADYFQTYPTWPPGDPHILIVPLPTKPQEVCIECFKGKDNINFGNCPYGCISGQKWNDANGNGQLDPGEPPIADCTITLTGPNGLHLEAKTAADGSYKFDLLKPGAYTVCESCLKEGCEITKPTTIDKCYHITLTAGQCSNDNDFGNYCCLGTISGIKFADNNLNGIFDDGFLGECGYHAETGLAGWKIRLEKTDGTLVAEKTTDAEGKYRFVDIPRGTYVVKEVLQSGWKQTAPTSVYYTVVVECNDTANKNFGNTQYASVKGIKAADCDKDGAYDPGETPLAGWDICLKGTAFDGTVVNRCTKSDINGEWQFESVLPGKYEFTEIAKPGWTQTCGPAPRCIKAGDQITGLAFCNKLDYECPCRDLDRLVFVHYSAGWNMVAAPGGFDFGLGSLWWYDPVQNAYVSSLSIVAGRGYWANLSAGKTVAFPVSDLGMQTVYLSPGWNMIGNSLTKPIDLPPSMTIVWWYDPVDLRYKQISTLEVGQGCWVYSTSSQMIMLTARP